MKPAFALADRLRAGETLFSAWAGLPLPMIGELLARDGWDVVSFDMQHGLVGRAEAAAGIAAVALAGKPAAVRIPLAGFGEASWALDMGAEAVICPMVNSGSDARAFAAAMKFPPLGGRSWGPTRALTLTGVEPQAYLAAANAGTLAFAMVETERALAAIDEILDTPGIDGVFVGPSDVSVTVSRGAHIDPARPEVDQAIRHVAEKAQAHGRLGAIYATTPERARFFASLGYRFIAVGSDVGMLRAGSTAILDRLRG
ncbi:MAG: aldolase/citrate lyase family protein [Pseudomonadota bacterium]|nr:aldolase/citrate lyase family protein [Pseudomonadota bacterium]